MSLDTAQHTNVHYPWLNVMRFMAALMVVFCHSRNDFFLPYGELIPDQQTPLSMAFYALGRLGHEAVIVFFVLSGFLVGGRGLKRIYNQTFDLKSYVVDRCVRIYLPLIASILLFLLTCILLHQPFDVVCAIGNLLNLQESFVEPLVGPYWSLAYEMWFYISVAAFYLILKNDKGKWLGIALVAMIGVVFVNGLDFFYFFLWLLGAFTSLTLPGKNNKAVMILSVVAIFLSMGLTQVLSDSDSVSIVLPGISNYKMAELLLALSMCAFVQQIVLIPPKRRFWRAIEEKVGSCAKFSYTLYLSHRIFFLLLFAYFFTEGKGQFIKSDLFIYAIFFISTVVLCYLFYLVTERYTPNVKRFIKSRI